MRQLEEESQKVKAMLIGEGHGLLRSVVQSLVPGERQPSVRSFGCLDLIVRKGTVGHRRVIYEFWTQDLR